MKLIRRDPDKGYLDCLLWVPKHLINVTATQSALSFLFTDSYSKEQRVLCLWKETTHHLLVPRAFWEVGSLPCEVIDCRPKNYTEIDFKSRVKLDHRPGAGDVLLPTGDDVQQLSIKAMKESMGGVLQLACGKGKTVVALEKIAQGRVPALVLVDNTNLLEQWLDDVKEFLDVPGGVGVIGAGKFDWHKGLVLATYQTLAQRADEMPEEVRRWFGQVFWDEAHHINAPTFSKTADLFYGQRYALTATPRRDDGLHIICDFHIGRVLHRDLRQPLKARLIFRWTGLELDLTDPRVSQAVLDVNGEIHTSKVPGYFGQWRNRLWMIMQDCIDALNVGRKTLVLSNSVDEVVNLMTLWTRGAHADLYTDVPVPTPAEVGWNLMPLNLTPVESKKLEKNIRTAWSAMAKGQPVNENAVTDMMMRYQQHLTHRAIVAEHDKRQRAFLKQLLTEQSSAGLMTFGVPAKQRQQFLHERPVVFAITKYGKEGLDCPDLDTVLVSTLFSGKNALQQLMGRPTRPKAGKKKPMVVFYVDNVGQYHGMSQKLMKHLRDWPHEEGGPFDYELLDYPKVSTCKASTLAAAFGQ